MYKINSKTYKKLDGWEYRYSSNADREAFIAKYFPQYLHLYLYIGPGIHRADFWRYLVLYKYGGFYADMDSKLFYKNDSYFSKSINDPDATFNVIKASAGLFNNCLIMCSKENPIMKEIIDAVTSKCQGFYEEDYKIFPYSSWIYATGPEMYTSVINKHIDEISYFYDPEYEVDHCGFRHGDIYKDEMDRNQFMHLGQR